MNSIISRRIAAAVDAAEEERETTIFSRTRAISGARARTWRIICRVRVGKLKTAYTLDRRRAE